MGNDKSLQETGVIIFCDRKITHNKRMQPDASKAGAADAKR